MAIGKDVIGNIDCGEQILRIWRERFPPDAIDSIFPDMVKFMYLKRTGQKMDTYLIEFDTSRQKVEARMPRGSGFPD